MLKDGSAADKPSLASKFGGTIGRQSTQGISGFSVALGERQAKRLAADPAVAFVEQNKVLRAEATQGYDCRRQ
ncbi:protease inhibitor I9 family protein [Amycolatopsis sp. cmx-11-51]|uniref:protease inhibitor I9 family protein n=1 Tax=unclassified Amycolatopsis TaxID=2618356 RepID=UPI0039E6B210